MTEPAKASATDSAGLPSPLQSVSDMRMAAKWLIGTAAAVGAVLVGGAPLTAVGKLHSIQATALAFGGLVVGLVGVAWAIWHTSDVFIPPTTTLGDLHDGKLADLRVLIARDSKAFYGPFGVSVDDLEAACRRFDTAAANLAVMTASESDDKRRRLLRQGYADAKANAAQAQSRREWLLGLIHAWKVRTQLRRARLHVFIGAALVGLGLVTFAAATSFHFSGSGGAKKSDVTTFCISRPESSYQRLDRPNSCYAVITSRHKNISSRTEG